MHNDVIKSYERQATQYDRRFAGYIDHTLGVALEMLQLRGTEKILDVACGTGELERRVTRAFPQMHMVGFDLSDAMLAEAKNKLAAFPNVQWQQGDSRQLPFPDNQFDIVISCSALHYMRDPQIVMREFARVTRPGGRVVILDWCRDFLFAKLYHYFRSATVPAHHNVYRLREMYELMRNAGLQPTRTRTFTTLMLWKMMCVEATK